MTTEEWKATCHKIVDFNGKYPIGSEFEWRERNCDINKFRVRTVRAATLTRDNRVLVRCRIVGLNCNDPEIPVDELEPIKPEEAK